MFLGDTDVTLDQKYHEWGMFWVRSVYTFFFFYQAKEIFHSSTVHFLFMVLFDS